MSDEHLPEAKATISLVYKLIGDLRQEMTEAIGNLDDKMTGQFDRLLNAIDSLRGAVVAEPLCHARHSEVESSISAAVTASEGDRQKLWDAVHDVQSQLKWAAGILIATFLGIVIAALNL